MILKYLIYSIAGGFCIFFLRKFPFTDRLVVRGFGGCNLCLGVWVYSFLAFVFDVNVFQEYFYVAALSELLTGAITSFIADIVVDGWKSKYSVTLVDVDK